MELIPYALMSKFAFHFPFPSTHTHIKEEIHRNNKHIMHNYESEIKLGRMHKKSHPIITSCKFSFHLS